jgi:hypothetical protein
MDEGFLQDLVSKSAHFLCSLSAETTKDHHGTLGTSASSDSEAIHGVLELIWDVSASSSASQTMGSMGCIEVMWGIAFQSDDDRVQELCFGALANMCLQSDCCCRLLSLPHAAVACVSLCIPGAGLNIRSGSYVQALRLSRVILGERAAAPRLAELLQPFVEAKVCYEIVKLFPEGHSQSDSELQTVLIDFAVFIMERAAHGNEFVSVADNFIVAGIFRAALQAVQGAASDMPHIAQLLSSCQNHAQEFNVYEQCDADSVIAASVAMMSHSSSSCRGVGMVCVCYYH